METTSLLDGQWPSNAFDNTELVDSGINWSIRGCSGRPTNCPKQYKKRVSAKKSSGITLGESGHWLGTGAGGTATLAWRYSFSHSPKLQWQQKLSDEHQSSGSKLRIKTPLKILSSYRRKVWHLKPEKIIAKLAYGKTYWHFPCDFIQHSMLMTLISIYFILNDMTSY